jgi:hypothetical protein
MEKITPDTPHMIVEVVMFISTTTAITTTVVPRM